MGLEYLEHFKFDIVILDLNGTSHIRNILEVYEEYPENTILTSGIAKPLGDKYKFCVKPDLADKLKELHAGVK